MNTQFLSIFKNPDSAWRGKPFWAWNGRREAGELRRQIRVMHQMGLGGFFMHARVGLATPYLSDEWFDAVHACLAEARAREMEAWLYDEDRWPSGAADGYDLLAHLHEIVFDVAGVRSRRARCASATGLNKAWHFIRAMSRIISRLPPNARRTNVCRACSTLSRRGPARPRQWYARRRDRMGAK